MYDLLVIGSGIAGLTTALDAARGGRRVLLVTKERLEESNTWYAQGGIAAALGEDDTPDAHYEDTLDAGAGLCDPQAVRVLVDEGPAAVRQLAALGVPFDRHGPGLALTREAAHSQRRIVHAGGDATGAAVETTLADAVRAAGIEVREQATALELLVEDGVCEGVLLATNREQRLETGDSALHTPPQSAFSNLLSLERARAVVLATGGAGQLYQATTNPGVATGDGVALAYRAGAAIANLEFFQFHPTALYTAPEIAIDKQLGPLPTADPGQPFDKLTNRRDEGPGQSRDEGSRQLTAFLISEAVRGEGGYLRNAAGERFMLRAHPAAELAPRDIVARAIADEMLRTGSDYVYMDLTHLDAGLVLRRFPTIARACAERGIDITKDLIPVAPAAHYLMGGVVSDLWGRTSLPGLYACGEVAMTGVHGANRLASNSLLEGAVWGARIARDLPTWLAHSERSGMAWGVELSASFPSTLVEGPALRPSVGSTNGVYTSAPDGHSAIRQQLPRLMWRYVGITRDGEGLKVALAQIERWRSAPALDPHALTANLLLVAELATRTALLREESRGAHARSDFPHQRPEWQRYIVLRRP